MDTARYGVYLIPPVELYQAIDEIRTELHQKFGCQAAMKFMVHATLKGFFKLNGELRDLETALDKCLQNKSCFEVKMNAVNTFGQGVIKIDINWENYEEEQHNTELRKLHRDVYEVVQGKPISSGQTRGVAGEGFIADDCDFTPREYIGDSFKAHFTLAFKDIPQDGFQAVLDCAREKFRDICPKTFSTGTSVGLYRFCSQNWKGAWWETLEWERIKSWALIA